MIPSNNILTRDGRAQTYTLEAVLAALLLFSVIMFIAPSFALPSDQASVNNDKQSEQVTQEVETMLEQHTANGELKAAILNYNDDPGENKWANSGNLQDSHYWDNQKIPGPLSDSITEIETEHNVSLSIYLIPTTNVSAANSDDPNRTAFLQPPGNPSINNLGSESVTITLYNQDPLQAPATVHTRHGTALRQYSGGTKSLASANDFPVPEAAGPDGDGTVYNTVTVRVVIDRTEL
jgi:hypothetical protein